MSDEELEKLYATAMTVTRQNVSSKWGHPKYTSHVSSADLRTLCEGAVAFVRERRASELTTDSLTVHDVDALIRIRNDMRNAERRSPDVMYYPAHLVKAREALDRLFRLLAPRSTERGEGG